MSLRCLCNFAAVHKTCCLGVRTACFTRSKQKSFGLRTPLLIAFDPFAALGLVCLCVRAYAYAYSYIGSYIAVTGDFLALIGPELRT